MNKKRLGTSMAALMAFAFAFAPNYAAAQQKLPEGKDVLARYVKELGGKEKFKKVTSMTSKAKMVIEGQGISGDLVVHFMAPNLMKMNLDLGALGTQVQGTDGEISYESSTLQGDRILEGEEAARIMEEATSATLLEPEKVYKEIKCTKQEDVRGEKCNKVEMTRKSGSVDINWYSVKTGLLVRTQVTAKTPMGDLTVDSYPQDYKEVDGIMRAMKTVQEMGPIKFVITQGEITSNPKLDKSMFELPESIKKLKAKKKD